MSRGIGIGDAVCLLGGRRQFIRRELKDSEIEAEIARFADAVVGARNSITADIERTVGSDREHVVDLLESHLLILDDPAVGSKIRKLISARRLNAESAIQIVFDEYSSSIRNSVDQHLREKYLDIEDVADRLLTAIDTNTHIIQFKPGTVVAASELRASTILRFRDHEIVGIVTESGGWTSHSSILAREFGIPAIAGIPDLFDHIKDGVPVAVDGFTGEVLVNPSDSTTKVLKQRGIHDHTIPEYGSEVSAEQTKTLDGRWIVIRANTISLESLEVAQNAGARGIGLYRSESLIGKFGRLPTEDEQTVEYQTIAAAAGNDGVRIRTFDIDSDLLAERGPGRQKNPALGLRAIRLGLRELHLLIPQVRAILRASFQNEISVVVPMVTGVAEVNEFRAVLDQQADELKAAGVSIGSPMIGAMIEIPSAALLADQLAEVSDFLCLGTNDLAQYFLAADRDNESVAEWFRTLHPAMLRIVRSVIEKCRSANKPLVICGEMAGSPFYAPVLIGLGATELSMSPGTVEAVRRVICGIAFEEAAALSRELLSLKTADEIENAVAETARSKWLHLYPSGFLDQ